MHCHLINITNHAYFNLSGNGAENILSHTLGLNAHQMTPVDSTFMTTGEIVDIPSGDPFDFYTSPKPIGQDILADNLQLRNGHGYDHNFVLSHADNKPTYSQPTRTKPQADSGLTHATTLYRPTTGIALDVLTTKPGIQVYSDKFLDGTIVGKRGEVYACRNAVCLETQKHPNTPNNPA